jgi:hypothetical protein
VLAQVEEPEGVEGLDPFSFSHGLILLAPYTESLSALTRPRNSNLLGRGGPGEGPVENEEEGP